jgi:hypothetical protein
LAEQKDAIGAYRIWVEEFAAAHFAGAVGATEKNGE